MTLLPAEIRSNSGSFRGRCSSMPYSRHEGRQAKCAKHRTGHEGASGLMEIQWLPGFKSAGDRLGKRAGVQPEGGWRPFGYFSGEGKVPRRRQPWGTGAHSPRWKGPGPGGGAPCCAPARSVAGSSFLYRLDASAQPAQGAHSLQKKEKRGLFSPLFPLSR